MLCWQRRGEAGEKPVFNSRTECRHGCQLFSFHFQPFLFSSQLWKHQMCRRGILARFPDGAIN